MGIMVVHTKHIVAVAAAAATANTAVAAANAAAATATAGPYVSYNLPQCVHICD